VPAGTVRHPDDEDHHGVNTHQRSRYVDNDGVRVHYVDSDGDAQAPPVLFVPGMGDEAHEYHDLLDDLLPRRAVAADLRGRGDSDVPESGYSLDHHVSDVDAVVHAAGLDRFHLASYSRGTAYALGWAVANPERVLSVSIGDYPARQIRIPPELVEKFSARKWRGRPMEERMPRATIDAVFAAGDSIDFWDGLAGIGVPVLLLRGTVKGAIVTDELEATYRQRIPGVEVVPFAGSGHDLWRPDPHRFGRTLREFFARVDRGDTP
jgi:pimeloyl-ACP methyl ester carboxylesterase